MGETEVSQIKSLRIGQVGASVQVQSPQVWQHHCSKRLVMPNILSLLSSLIAQVLSSWELYHLFKSSSKS